MKNFDKLTENEKRAFLANMSEEERTQFFLRKKQWDAKQAAQKEQIKKRMSKFSGLAPEEQKKLLANLSPEQQQQLIKENKTQFYQKVADNFENMSAGEQVKFMANLTPQQQKEFIEEKKKIQLGQGLMN